MKLPELQSSDEGIKKEIELQCSQYLIPWETFDSE